MKTKTILFGIIVSVIAAMTMTSCSQYTCPTYSGSNVETYKKFKSYSHSRPVFRTKKHL